MKSPFILLIDDDPICNFVAGITLNHLKKDIFVKSCLSGREGLKILNKTSVKPDLIFLDINMPYMSGWQFIEKLREENLNDIPIVVLTSSVYQADKNIARRYDEVVDFISKPLKVEDLEEIKELALL